MPAIVPRRFSRERGARTRHKHLPPCERGDPVTCTTMAPANSVVVCTEDKAKGNRETSFSVVKKKRKEKKENDEMVLVNSVVVCTGDKAKGNYETSFSVVKKQQQQKTDHTEE